MRQSVRMWIPVGASAVQIDRLILVCLAIKVGVWPDLCTCRSTYLPHPTKQHCAPMSNQSSCYALTLSKLNKLSCCALGMTAGFNTDQDDQCVVQGQSV